MEFEADILEKCYDIFQRLGWDVSLEEKIDGYDFRADLVLRYNKKMYGVVEVVRTCDFKNKVQMLNRYTNTYLNVLKPIVFIITNGYKYDVYHFGEFYGSLTIPPTPENVDLLFGGENDA